MTKKKPADDAALENSAATGAAQQDTEAENAAEAAVESAQEALDKLKGEFDELKDQYLRLAAEYDNYRKRTAKEREQLYSLAKASTVEALLPVYDNVELAVKQETKDEQYKQGVAMIARQLDDVFAKLGVTEIPAARGDEFDPELHNAVMHTEDETLDANRIAGVFQKGFSIEGKVIRHAVVQVAN